MTIIDKVNRWLMALSALWAFMLAVIITIDVTGRGLFGAPLTGSLEIITNSIVVIAFLQISYAVRSKSMLRADFILHLLPSALRRGLEAIGLLCGFAVFALLCYAVLDPLRDAFVSGEYEGEGALRVPTWPIYTVIAFGAALAAVNYVLLVIDEFRSWSKSDV